MNIRLALKNPATQVRIGLVALVIALVTRMLVARTPGLAGDWVDGGLGFLFGVAIAAMLVGLRRGGLRGPYNPGR
jgi:hypothetical protein